MKNPPSPVPAGHIHCFKCATTKRVTEFSINRQRRSGRDAWCKACRKAFYGTPKYKQWYVDHQRAARARKRAIVAERKAAVGCMDCGERHPACLEYHHLDPSRKEHNVVRLVDSNAGLRRIEEEAAKCVVLCSNCHRKRHYEEKRRSVESA